MHKDGACADKPAVAENKDVVLQVPLQLAIRETSDAGTPITAGAPDSQAGKVYRSIADKVYKKLSNMPTQLQPPLLSHNQRP